MSRLTEKELAHINKARNLNAASAVSLAGPKTAAASANNPSTSMAGWLLTPLKDMLERRAMASQLYGLDDRILADIGVERASIPQTVRAAGAARRGGRKFRSSPGARLRARQDLNRLSDHLLNDIGIARADIPQVVDGLLGESPITRFSTALAKSARGLLSPVTAFIERRRAETALQGLDERLLDDIGICRGDIPRILASKSKSAGPVTKFGQFLKRHFAVRETVNALQAQPDYILADIGLERGDIRATAKRLVAEAAREAKPAPQPLSTFDEVVHELHKVTPPYRAARKADRMAA